MKEIRIPRGKSVDDQSWPEMRHIGNEGVGSLLGNGYRIPRSTHAALVSPGHPPYDALGQVAERRGVEILSAGEMISGLLMSSMTWRISGHD